MKFKFEIKNNFRIRILEFQIFKNSIKTEGTASKHLWVLNVPVPVLSLVCQFIPWEIFK